MSLCNVSVTHVHTHMQCSLMSCRTRVSSLIAAASCLCPRQKATSWRNKADSSLSAVCGGQGKWQETIGLLVQIGWV